MMSSQISQQYAFRAQKRLGLVHGTPCYSPVKGFADPGVPARTYQYSNDGRLFAYALPTSVRIFQAENAILVQELNIPNVVELNFSPRGTYLSTWERPIKLEDGAQHKNLRVFSVSTGQELIAFSQKSQENWDIQYTVSESHAVRLVAQEIQVFRPAEWSKGIIDKLRVENAAMISVSPGLNPSIAVFVAEKKGAPASVKIYGLLALSPTPTSAKTFFKADRTQIKWNDLGTQALIITQTEVDNSNMSYYGETSLYLLSAAGNFDCRVTLDKDGPIHDVAWSPNSKEFGVVYGYMPAKAMLFDSRVRTLHDFGSSPINTISFNPQGRLLLLAGFGNLAGKIDLFDRRTLTKLCTIDAPNTSHCSWSPCGQFLLTAVLSPRLRVDNGIKVWHCSGPLVHVQPIDELYQAGWRPTPVDRVPAFPPTIPQAPPPSESVLNGGANGAKTPSAKPAGAYRPPGLRGLATPTIFKREDEGGSPARTGTGSGHGGNGTPTRGYGRGSGTSLGTNGVNGGRRYVPGAPSRTPSTGSGAGGATPGGAGSGAGAAATGGTGETAGEKKRKKKDAKKGKASAAATAPGNGDISSGAVTPSGGGEEAISTRPSIDMSGSARPSIDVVDGSSRALGPTTPLTPKESGESNDIAAKKIRNLNKKLKAIDELKEKAKRGDRLEATQLKKIEGEADIRKELDALVLLTGGGGGGIAAAA
ncbi:eukaryotic translation initiation factor 2A [Pisolithus croceorrhizus]|nr:eukaryotic translation initiation factor 2A [Pisolithus croceorrhizus]KAI6128012.1 eukaryotic translation initiation factor 2A [Pisolithus croceorrhizus]